MLIESYVDNLTWKSGSYLVSAILVFVVRSILDFRYFGLLSRAHAIVNLFWLLDTQQDTAEAGYGTH